MNQMSENEYRRAEFLNKAYEESVRKLKRKGFSPEVSSDWGSLMKKDWEQNYKEAEKRFGAFPNYKK